MQTKCHLSVLIHEQARKYGSRTALTFSLFGKNTWESVSWEHFSQRVKQVSNALLELGVRPQDNLAVFSQNCVEYLYTDFGAYGVRAVTIPFYATSSEQQIQFMINDAQVRFVFVGEQEQYNKAHRIFALCPSLERIIIYDRSVRISSHDPHALYFDDFVALGAGLPRQAEVEALWRAASDDDLCNILYTSGTTGDSKGVQLTYGQYAAALVANDKCVPVTDKDRVINFLPFTHVFERGWSYLCLSEGAELIINTDPREIQESMKQTHPTCMSAVPRFWEKVYQAVKDKIDRSTPMQQKIFRHALEVGRRHNVDCLARGKRPSLALALEYKLIDKTIWGAWFSAAGCLVLFAVNIIFIPTYSYMACAWGGFAGYATAMLLSYIVGQKKNPVRYPLKSIGIYVLIAGGFYAIMAYTPEEWPVWTRLSINTVLILLFVGHILKHDLPVRSLPVIGKYFRKPQK